MIKYFFSFQPENHIAEIKILIPKTTDKNLDLHLPMWRPGRYQLQNFAKNILNFKAKTTDGEHLVWKKTKKNIWTIFETSDKNIEITYQYYAKELNAGGSYIDQNLIYINPVNLCLYLPKKINERLEVFLEPVNVSEQLACGIQHQVEAERFKLCPVDFHHFFDSPLIISKHIFHQTFDALGVKFHLWIEGYFQIDSLKLLADLKKVAESQIKLFREFPEKDFHFLLIIPEQTYYHGVEHRNSTVMVLGENGALPENYYKDLLGLASHELFHAWNIAKIRPKELLPYDYDKENYFETCFVAEGFTTFYGDKILFESGVISYEEYLHELETTFRRHFEEADSAAQSLLESSFDLWVDGYEKGIPNKKVSVYSKGAIVAMILDLKIRQKYKEKKSLDDIMRKLWRTFGDQKRGYTYQNIKNICEKTYGDTLQEFFEVCIESNQSILDYTNGQLMYLGLKIVKYENKYRISRL